MLRSFKLGSIFCDLLLADFLQWSPGNPHEQSKTLNCNLFKQHRNRVKCLYCCPNNDNNNNNNKGETHKKLLSSSSWPKQCFSFRLDCCSWLVGNNHRASNQPTTLTHWYSVTRSHILRMLLFLLVCQSGFTLQ